MAEAAVEIPTAVPARKARTSRKALQQKSSSTNEANILAGQISDSSPVPIPATFEDVAKENHESLSQPRSGKKKSRGAQKVKQSKQSQSFERDLQEMQEKFVQLRLEKEQTEELLKTRDEMLKIKDEELETRGREQEKLQIELKRLQKLKEFKPTVTFPFHSLRDKEQDKEKKNKKGKQETKKPSPAYILWSKDQWTEMKKANPNAEFKEMSNILGTKWKTISAEDKKPYEEKYQSEKEAYLQIVGKEKRENEAMKLLEDEQKQKIAMELLDQYLQFKQEAEKESKKKKKAKDPLKPKHPVSAFLLFSNERRAALVAENKNVVEIAKIAGEEWKNMSDEQKQPYEEIAKKSKTKYQEEMELYKQQKDEEAENLKKEEEQQVKILKHEALQLLKKKEKTENLIKKGKENLQKKKKEKSNTDPNKPKKPASSFLLFSKEARKSLLQERPGINKSTIKALISVKWKELDEEERKIWNERAAESREVYRKELEEYKKSVAAAMADNNPHQ